MSREDSRKKRRNRIKTTITIYICEYYITKKTINRTIRVGRNGSKREGDQGIESFWVSQSWSVPIAFALADLPLLRAGTELALANTFSAGAITFEESR
jgi:hypothetical protein